MEKKLPELTVILTVYKRLDYTKQTLESLVKTLPKDTNFVIYDDASGDPAIVEYLSDFIKKDWNTRLLILGNENRGWGAGVNMCLKHTFTDWVLVSNNDVVYEKDWYAKCLAIYDKEPKLGILGVWKHIAHGLMDQRGDFIQKDQMPAVGWLMKKSVIDDIGFFPENGPCHTKGGNGEDVTYCIKAAQKGYIVGGPVEDVAQHIDGY